MDTRNIFNQSSISQAGVITATDPVTFSNKTIDSNSNTITVNGPSPGTNINSVINQPLLTSSSPTFAGLDISNTQFIPWNLTTSDNSPHVGYSVPVSAGRGVSIESRTTIFNGLQIGTIRLTNSAKNIGGVLTLDTPIESFYGLNGIGGTLSYVVNGTNIDVVYTGDGTLNQVYCLLLIMYN